MASPVRHSEWSRTGTSSRSHGSPLIRAACSRPLLLAEGHHLEVPEPGGQVGGGRHRHAVRVRAVMVADSFDELVEVRGGHALRTIAPPPIQRISRAWARLSAVEPFADIQLDTDLTVVGSGHFHRVGEARVRRPGPDRHRERRPVRAGPAPRPVPHDPRRVLPARLRHRPPPASDQRAAVLHPVRPGRARRRPEPHPRHDGGGRPRPPDRGRARHVPPGMERGRAGDPGVHPGLPPRHPSAHSRRRVRPAQGRGPDPDQRGARASTRVELVGPSSAFTVNHSGIRRYTDSVADRWRRARGRPGAEPRTAAVPGGRAHPRDPARRRRS